MDDWSNICRCVWRCFQETAVQCETCRANNSQLKLRLPAQAGVIRLPAHNWTCRTKWQRQRKECMTLSRTQYFKNACVDCCHLRQFTFYNSKVNCMALVGNLLHFDQSSPKYGLAILLCAHNGINNFMSSTS